MISSHQGRSPTGHRTGSCAPGPVDTPVVQRVIILCSPNLMKASPLRTAIGTAEPRSRQDTSREREEDQEEDQEEDEEEGEEAQPLEGGLEGVEDQQALGR